MAQPERWGFWKRLFVCLSPVVLEPGLLSRAHLIGRLPIFCGRFLCYDLSMGVRFTSSADKHGIPREDSLYAIMHAKASAEVEGEAGETTMVYVGHPHGQTDRCIEVIAAHRLPRTIVIFHAMPLGDLFRHLLDEGK